MLCINPECKKVEQPVDTSHCINCERELLVNSRFKLNQLISDSFHGKRVYEVTDTIGNYFSPPGSNRILKVSNNKILFSVEAQALFAFRGKGIPKFDTYDDKFSLSLNSSHELHCLAMEKIEGKSLDTWIKSNNILTEDLAIDWLRQIFHILDRIHRQGWIYGDVKPANIMLKPDGTLVLIDFESCVRVFDPHFTNSYLPDVGFHRDSCIIGTPNYMAPETFKGIIFPQSDFFAIGQLFVELATGQSSVKYRKNTSEWYQYAPQFSIALVNFIDRLRHKSPAKRYFNTECILNCLHTEVIPYIHKEDFKDEFIFPHAYGRLKTSICIEIDDFPKVIEIGNKLIQFSIETKDQYFEVKISKKKYEYLRKKLQYLEDHIIRITSQDWELPSRLNVIILENPMVRICKHK
jgi:serine/threonine protein kinase